MAARNTEPALIETRPGIYTTEFWSHWIIQGLLILNNFGVWSFCPPRYAVPAQAFAFGFYALARGWAKSGNPVPTAQALGLKRRT
jgi:hypothetical protein